MAKTLDKVDVVTVGAGWTGGIIAAEAAKKGLKVLSLERGRKMTTEDYQHVHDELKYSIRYELMQDISKETLTFRNNPDEKALPMRQMGSFLLGNNTGGAGTHWDGKTYRFLPYDFEVKSESEKRYGKEKLREDEGYMWQDWGITYDELEPYYDTFEKTCGVSGEENPLGGKRSNPYPTKPMVKTTIIKKFEKAAKDLGLHPYMIPSSTLSENYTNPDGETINQCQYCAFCERFACEYDAKASPEVTVLKTALKTGNYEIRTHSNVVEVLTDKDDKSKVTGVKFIDTRTGEEFIQPAEIVALTSYVFNNYKLLRNSDIGEQYDPKTQKGTLGRNYCYQIAGSAIGYFDEQFNIFMGAGGLAMTLDDYNGDNFDHKDLDFLHGGSMRVIQMGNRPILHNEVKKDTASWGADWKDESIYNFTRIIEVDGHGATSPYRYNYLDIDKDYKDAHGMPQVKLTYDYTEADRARAKYLADRAAEIAEEMGANHVDKKGDDHGPYDIEPYQSTHNTGGTIMGTDKKTSVVNTWLQHWDRDNLFVVGAGNFPHNSGYNPTGTVGALAYRCAEGIISYHEDNRRLEK